MTIPIFGEEIVISGIFRGDPLLSYTTCKSTVIYGDIKIEESSDYVVSWTETEIRLKPIKHAPGNIEIKVNICNWGWTNVLYATVKLELQQISAAFSSLMGGMEIKLTGYGFAGPEGDSDLINIYAGDIPCEIKEHTLKQNELVCVTGPYNIKTELTLGQNRWEYVRDRTKDATDIEVEVGNEVHWKWHLDIPGVQPKIQFQKVAKGESENANGAYWSEEYGGEGKFVKRFNSPGTFYYSTGLIDSDFRFVAGSIKVVQPVDKPLKIKMEVDSHEAVHVGSSDNNRDNLSTCEQVPSYTTVANPPTETGFFVTYSWMVTPIVTKWYFKNPSIPDMENNSPATAVSVSINIDTKSCFVEISVGDHACLNTVSTGTVQTCVLQHEEKLDVRES